MYEIRSTTRGIQNRNINPNTNPNTNHRRANHRLFLAAWIATLALIASFALLFHVVNQIIKNDYIEHVYTLVADAAGEPTAIDNQSEAVEPIPSASAGDSGQGTVGDSQPGADEVIAWDLLGGLNSPYAILVDLASGTTLAERESQQRIYPASMTKIMTALLVIENSSNLDEEIELPSDIFHILFAEDATLAGFEPGEIATIRDLLYGVLLPSGAESSLALANKISGSESAFVDLMNQKAQQLGMVHTHFANSTGLHGDHHNSTVADLAILLRYALHNETFRTIFTSSRYSVQPTNRHPNGFTFRSTMFKYMESVEVSGGEILGGKTGYTEAAGQCLASLARINDREYILVTAGANGDPLGEQLHIVDAVAVYNQISVWDGVR